MSWRYNEEISLKQKKIQNWSYFNFVMGYFRSSTCESENKNENSERCAVHWIAPMFQWKGIHDRGVTDEQRCVRDVFTRQVLSIGTGGSRVSQSIRGDSSSGTLPKICITRRKDQTRSMDSVIQGQSWQFLVGMRGFIVLLMWIASSVSELHSPWL